MRIDKKKFDMSKARACMGTKELVEAGIPRGTLSRIYRDNLRPETIGKIAKALGADVKDIIETEDQSRGGGRKELENDDIAKKKGSGMSGKINANKSNQGKMP